MKDEPDVKRELREVPMSMYAHYNKPGSAKNRCAVYCSKVVSVYADSSPKSDSGIIATVSLIDGELMVETADQLHVVDVESKDHDEVLGMALDIIEDN